MPPMNRNRVWPLQPGDQCPCCRDAVLAAVHCETCGGRGSVEVNERVPATSAESVKFRVRYACPECGGTGYVVTCGSRVLSPADKPDIVEPE